MNDDNMNDNYEQLEKETSWFRFSVGNNKAIVNIKNMAKIEEYKADMIEKTIGNKDFISGVIDSLEEPITVLDLKKYLHIEETEEEKNDKKIILIVKREDKDTGRIEKIGIKTDEKIETINLNVDTIFYEQDTTVVFHQFFHEVAKIDGKFVYKLDVDKLFKEIPVSGRIM
jgi:chemotaxis signal transduction protein